MKLRPKSRIEISKVFSNFKKIPEQAYHDYLIFYQNYFSQIEMLNFEEYSEIKYNYLKALFHLEKLSLFYKQADSFLLEIINNTEFNEEHKEMYQSILFLKAKVLTNELKHKEAISILSELYKLNANEKRVSKYLFQLLFQEQQHQQKKWIGFIVLLIICSLGSTGVYFLLLQPFRPEWSMLAIEIRNSAFIGSLILFSLLYLNILQSTFLKMKALRSRSNYKS